MWNLAQRVSSSSAAAGEFFFQYLLLRSVIDISSRVHSQIQILNRDILFLFLFDCIKEERKETVLGFLGILFCVLCIVNFGI